MKTFLFVIIFFTGLMGLSAGAEAATHFLGTGKQTLSPSTGTIYAGYYSSTTLSDVDPNLAGGNIKSGVTIFGKPGTYASTTSYTFPDTGQTVRYSTATGDDSNYQPAAAQLSYSILNPVGVSSVTVDNRTGLMWVTNPADAGIGGSYSWEDAVALCKGLTYATYADWRLPNIRELMSIMNYQHYGSTANAPYFLTTGTDNYPYWSSTTYAQNTLSAWLVIFDWGQVAPRTKTSDCSIRCVRAGP